MKKILIAFGLTIMLTLTGCQSNVVLDLGAIGVELDQLQDGKFSIHAINVDGLEAYEGLEYVYDYDFEEVFGLDNTLISEYSVQYNEDNGQLLAVLKANDGELETIKEQMDSFVKDLENVSYEEYQGYLIYVSSLDNTKVMESIKKSSNPVFNNLLEIPISDIETMIGVDPSNVAEILVKVPMMMTQSSMYIIVKPLDGQEDVVKEQLDAYMTRLEEQWVTYLPDQYELVKNRKEETLGDYLIYIISSDNELVFENIKN